MTTIAAITGISRPGHVHNRVEKLYVVPFIRPDGQQLRWCASWWAHGF